MGDAVRVLRAVAETIGAFGLGLVAVFFTAGPALFADGGGAASRLPIVVVGSLVLLVLGYVLGLENPARWRWLGACLAFPVLPVVIFFESAGNPDPLGFWLLGAAFIASYVAAALFGARLGAGTRLARTRKKDS